MGERSVAPPTAGVSYFSSPSVPKVLPTKPSKPSVGYSLADILHDLSSSGRSVNSNYTCNHVCNHVCNHADNSATRPVDITMTLGLDFEASGRESSGLRAGFTQSLAHDLGNASALHPANFHILKLIPGSIIIDIPIQPDPLGRCPSPLDVASDLATQVGDATSPLRKGTIS